MRTPRFLLFLAILPLFAAGGAGPAPARLAVPSVTIGPHRVVVDSIQETVVMTRSLAEKLPDSAIINQHHASIKLRIVSPSPAAASAVDGFFGEFHAETDRGDALTISNEGTAFMSDGAMLFATADEMDPRVRSLRRLSGRVRLYPHGEQLQLRVPAQEGAEAHHASGLALRLQHYALAGDQTKLELTVDWPGNVSVRDEDDEPFHLLGDLGGTAGTLPLTPAQGKVTMSGGRKRIRLIGRISGLRGQIRALILQCVVRTGTPVILPFTLTNVAFPYALAVRPAQPAASRFATPQQVLINGRSAGIGLLEVGIASRLRATWGPVRWERLSTDTMGRALFTFPAPGRYRVLRRWRASDPAYAVLLEKIAWEGADVDVTIATGKPPRVVSLTATGAPDPPVAAGSRYETTTRGYRVRALSVQEGSQPAIISYELDPSRVWLRAARIVKLTVEITAPDAAARAALAAATISGAAGPDGHAVQPVPLDYEGQEDLEAGLTVRVMSPFSRLNPEWKSLATVDGELSIYPRVRIATLDVPLATISTPGNAPLEFESDGIRLRAERVGSAAVSSYRVALAAPGDTALLLAERAAPALLDAQKRPVKALLRGPARPLGSPGSRAAGISVTFDEPEGPPAFLRLPVIFRSGKPETHGFRLTDIPLPLSEGG